MLRVQVPAARIGTQKGNSTMKIHKVRYGFATNSSSSHSLLILAPGQTAEDYLIESGEFGWNFFTAASPEAKRLYLAVTLRHALEEHVSPEIASTVIKEWVGIDLPPNSADRESYIDHQSIMCLPYSWDGKGVDRDFFFALRDYIMRPDLVILGGNDNAEHHHRLSRGGKRNFTLVLPQDVHSHEWVCRHDPLGYWVLFNRKDGTKVRMTLDRDSKHEPQKATTPELVDLKITNRCPFQCLMCYQDSVPDGEEGSERRLWAVQDALSEMRVFEVAIGGGEPTLQPGFWSLVKDFRRHGVVPNFTTRNLAWMRDPALVNIFNECCGAFAFSVDKSDGVEELVRLCAIAGIKHDRVNVQYVVGVSYAGVYGVLYDCNRYGFRCTLLGYKTTGRGDKFETKEDDWVRGVQILHNEGKLPPFGIDTMLAASHEAELQKAGIPKWCYEVREGAFSMYIDAVTMQMGPSSYCDQGLMRPLPESNYKGEMKAAIRAAFAEM